MKLFIVAILILLSATLANAATFTLTWTDNSDNEDGFIVERNPVVGNNVLGDSSTFGEVGRVGKSPPARFLIDCFHCGIFINNKHPKFIFIDLLPADPWSRWLISPFQPGLNVPAPFTD